MESDRFKQNQTLYIIGMVCLVLALAILALGAYVFPFLIFDWVYDVPEQVFDFREYLISNYNLSYDLSSWLVWLALITPGLIFAFIAYYSSNQIDNQLYAINNKNEILSEPVKKDLKDMGTLISKIVIAIIGMLIAIFILQWILYVPQV